MLRSFKRAILVVNVGLIRAVRFHVRVVFNRISGFGGTGFCHSYVKE
jgi:hypothetical protein